MRDRTWLREFLHLGSRAGAAVPARDVERQEDTVLRALAMLDKQPGLVLADEVGMGKTYEALGVIAARHRDDPARRTLVLTPGPDLNRKWMNEFGSFCDPVGPMYRAFEGVYAEALTLKALLTIAPKHQIWIAPVSIFTGGRASADLAYLLSLFFHTQDLRGNQVAAAFRRYRDGALERVDIRTERFLDCVEWRVIEPVLGDVMRGSDRKSRPDIERLFLESDYALFENKEAVDKALADLRFRLVHALLPEVDLLVIDEAHKLKNADSVRARAVRKAFDRKFHKALFLTATPFQLDVGELRQVLRLFARAKDAPSDIEQHAIDLFEDIRSYQSAYTSFETSWRRLDEVAVADFGFLYANDPTLSSPIDEPNLRGVVGHARELLQLKRTRIEPSFRRWMIRSLREDKRTYRQYVRTPVRATGGDGIPFLLYERFIAELFRSGDRTHKAAVQINMVSSYAAAREGDILSERRQSKVDTEMHRYRSLLQRVLGDLKDEQGGHPKMNHVVADALAAAERGEKTLIFCARTATLRALKQELDEVWTAKLVARWRTIDPHATRETIFGGRTDEERSRGRHSALRERIHRTQDLLYLALRERYLQTVVDLGAFGREHVSQVVERANVVLREQRVSASRAARLDWALVKRSVERATAALKFADAALSDFEEHAELTVLAASKYAQLGYDHFRDGLEPDEGGDHQPTWSIDASHVATILDPSPNLWTYLKGPLHGISDALRVRTVERVAHYLTFREVPFIIDLLTAAKEQGLQLEPIESASFLRFIDKFWTTPPGRRWIDLLRSFLNYIASFDEKRRREVLDDALQAGYFVRHTLEGESRERLREAFNTPLHPMILVANEVMQEGLDLHHQCARVVHHDLAWNPAQLEQRVGRIDRLGSLTQRRREKDSNARLHVRIPLITNTIDERLDRTIRAREKWLEFLLGATPQLSEFDLDEDPAPELPAAFADALKIDLGPRVGD